MNRKFKTFFFVTVLKSINQEFGFAFYYNICLEIWGNINAKKDQTHTKHKYANAEVKARPVHCKYCM